MLSAADSYLTQAQRIENYVRDHPGQSAYQIARALELDPSSVSSMLLGFVRKNKMQRIKGRGPRGGFTYYRKKV
jgi:DNA-binding CsgD family transcriptional regulator